MIVEPSAEIRQAASAARQAYVAFVEQGFTPDEALELVKALLAGARSNGE